MTKWNPRIIAGTFFIVCSFNVHAMNDRDQIEAARCQKEVRGYLEILKFIRDSAGTQIGDRVASDYLSESQVRMIVNEQGTCAAAQIVREKSGRRG